jgi:endoglucanase
VKNAEKTAQCDKLQKLCSVAAVSGFEKRGTDDFIKIFKQFGIKKPKADAYGNVYAEKRAKKAKINILIDAHCDEIGLIVTEVLENGFLAFDTVGGVDKSNLLCSEVLVLGSETVYGVIGAIPPHLKDSRKKSPQDMLIDTGNAKIAGLVNVGDPVKIKPNFLPLLNGQYCATVSDNRAGLLAGLMIMEKFKGKANLTLSASVREETGLQGSKLFTMDKRFDLAVVIDVTHGYFDGLRDYRAFPVGGGFTLCYGGILQNKLVKKMIPFLKKKKYKFNVEVEPDNPGTNAYAFVNRGIPTVMLSIPQKYMHTAVETVSEYDIENLAGFVCKFPWDKYV